MNATALLGSPISSPAVASTGCISRSWIGVYARRGGRYPPSGSSPIRSSRAGVSGAQRTGSQQTACWSTMTTGTATGSSTSTRRTPPRGSGTSARGTVSGRLGSAVPTPDVPLGQMLLSHWIPGGTTGRSDTPGRVGKYRRKLCDQQLYGDVPVGQLLALYRTVPDFRNDYPARTADAARTGPQRNVACVTHFPNEGPSTNCFASSQFALDRDGGLRRTAGQLSGPVSAKKPRCRRRQCAHNGDGIVTTPHKATTPFTWQPSEARAAACRHLRRVRH